MLQDFGHRLSYLIEERHQPGDRSMILLKITDVACKTGDHAMNQVFSGIQNKVLEPVPHDPGDIFPEDLLNLVRVSIQQCGPYLSGHLRRVKGID